ncbi:cytoplasmic tRNA 2-thiolation protein 2 [Hyposmocoma kahamanoa]|uniref:cytoplasmic tRNA 2-thiolation protein 2 n=1 Tax=Hyposmocoma kahamanoa TaxID=1477025 RepID=UPI000E6D834C|nr:cytoplasmic tRNA 2-thiolation protein 2 [Hyposmocoma kahamanoa]
MICKKCKNPGTIVLRKKDNYCEECFTASMNHKFRACIGKNKILSSNEKVLVCLSGGTGSSVLLNLIFDGISVDSHKKLRIKVCFLHVLMDAADDNTLNQAQKIMDQCRKRNFNVHVTHISEYMKPSSELLESYCLPSKNLKLEQEFSNFINKMPSTISNDLYPKIKRSLFIRYAKLLNCNLVFTAETTTTLASNLLSNLALGRGSQVQNDVGLCDTRDDTVTIVRPMRDISKEELDHYLNIKQLEVPHYDKTKQNSLQSVINTFVINLQESFPATISTVCKTADKISAIDEVQTKETCIMCQSNVGTEKTTLTAFDATNFSRTISNSELLDGGSSNHLHFTENNINKSMFPFIYKHLCFSCSRNYSEMKHTLPNHVQNLLKDK